MAQIYFDGKNELTKNIKKAEILCKKAFEFPTNLSHHQVIYQHLLNIYYEIYGLEEGNQRAFDFYYEQVYSGKLTTSELHQKFGNFFYELYRIKEAFHYLTIAEQTGAKMTYTSNKRLGMIYINEQDEEKKNTELGQTYLEKALEGAKKAHETAEELSINYPLGTKAFIVYKTYKSVKQVFNKKSDEENNDESK